MKVGGGCAPLLDLRMPRPEAPPFSKLDWVPNDIDEHRERMAGWISRWIPLDPAGFRWIGG